MHDNLRSNYTPENFDRRRTARILASVAIGLSFLFATFPVDAQGPSTTKTPNPNWNPQNQGDVQPNGPHMKMNGRDNQGTPTPTPDHESYIKSTDQQEQAIDDEILGTNVIVVPIVFNKVINPANESSENLPFDPYPAPDTNSKPANR